MLCFALKYRPVIDKITVDKKLPQLRKFELDDPEWKVVEDLVSVLEVLVDPTQTLLYQPRYSSLGSAINRPHCFSPEIQPRLLP